MGWFKRSKQNISAESKKREIPDGQWVKCAGCGEIIHIKQLELNIWTCFKCDFHFRIGSAEYISFLFDPDTFQETNAGMKSADPLEFSDTKKIFTKGYLNY